MQAPEHWQLEDSTELCPHRFVSDNYISLTYKLKLMSGQFFRKSEQPYGDYKKGQDFTVYYRATRPGHVLTEQKEQFEILLK